MQHTKVSANLLKEENPVRFNYVLNPHRDTENTYEKKQGKKLTIPDQSMSVKEILLRHTRGQRIPDQMIGYYDDDNDPLGLEGTNIETLDLSQKYDLLRAVQNQTRDLRSRYNKDQNDKKISKLKDEIAKELSKQKSDTQHQDS